MRTEHELTEDDELTLALNRCSDPVSREVNAAMQTETRRAGEGGNRSDIGLTGLARKPAGHTS